MNSIFSARLLIDAAVCLISSPTCSWWLPSSLWIAGYGINSKISCWMTMTYLQSAHKHEDGMCSHWEAAWISSPRYPKHSWYSLLCLFVYRRPVWWDHQISWRSLQPELYSSVSDRKFRPSKWTYHSRHDPHWRTSLPMAAMGAIHLVQSRTWVYWQFTWRTSRNAIKTYQMTWIWSSTSLAFDLSWMKVITASSSSLPPASNPGESWKMNPGLLLKVNERRTSWIPR